LDIGCWRTGGVGKNLSMWNLYFDTFTLKTNRKKEGDSGGKPVCIAMSCLQRRAVSRPNKRPWPRLASPISPHMGCINPKACCRFTGAIYPPQCSFTCYRSYIYTPDVLPHCYITHYIKRPQRGFSPWSWCSRRASTTGQTPALSCAGHQSSPGWVSSSAEAPGPSSLPEFPFRSSEGTSVHSR